MLLRCDGKPFATVVRYGYETPWVTGELRADDPEEFDRFDRAGALERIRRISWTATSSGAGDVAGARKPRPRRTRQLARLTAETTARSEAVVIEVAMPTPQTTLSPTAHST
ncbi:hypothetical protein FB390_0891 [Nocardia bhagyanarayanae]|uniref:Uncharacterized protein n=1 Tax=Nocardia bhagyanarayanae TaxID=1215925 RepID=A0A543F640_9NOCA|nr:hypothetical protein FB390_0891 [Nocardia bhagyanarayanae]